MSSGAGLLDYTQPGVFTPTGIPAGGPSSGTGEECHEGGRSPEPRGSRWVLITTLVVAWD